MGWDGNGNYTRAQNFSADASAGIKILAAHMDSEIDDIASAIQIAWARDGQNVPTANIPMGGKRFVNVGAPVSVNNYMRVREFIENVPIFMQDTESSADHISVSAQYFTSVSVNQAPTDGTKIIVRAKSNKSSAALYLNGHSANVAYTEGSRIGAAMTSGGLYELVYSSTQTAWHLQNPDRTSQNIKYESTSAEIAAGVTPTNYAYQEGYVFRYATNAQIADVLSGALAVDLSNAIQAAIDVGKSVFFNAGSYAANNLTQSANYQRFYALGTVRIIKNANGDLLTCSGNDVEFSGVIFQGDGASPTYTGHNLVSSGDNLRLVNCASYWCPGRAVLATGNHTQIIGTSSIYQTTDGTSSGYDIELGLYGTNTRYHVILGIYTSQVTGGVLLIDTGAAVVQASQIGKLTIEAGTKPSGSGGNSAVGNRIVGDISCGLSSSTFAGNVCSDIAITFASGTSGHTFDRSNALGSGATITDSSYQSVVEDIRILPWQTYSCSWTAASVNPAIGNGSITAYYSKEGQRVTVNIFVSMGSTTTFGSGVWYFSLPSIPNTSIAEIGTAKIYDSSAGTQIVGVIQSSTDGTARLVPYSVDSVNNGQLTASRPMTWASGDTLAMSLTYFTG